MKIHGYSIYYSLYINQTRAVKLINLQAAFDHFIPAGVFINHIHIIQFYLKQKVMAKIQIAPIGLPLPVTISKPALFSPKISSLTPFSAVAPARFVSAVHRLHVHISLETIHEEENEDHFHETFKSSPVSITSMCSLEVHNPLSSSYNSSHNYQCA